jgi:hypothetical protein
MTTQVAESGGALTFLVSVRALNTPDHHVLLMGGGKSSGAGSGSGGKRLLLTSATAGACALLGVDPAALADGEVSLTLDDVLRGGCDAGVLA